MFFLTTLSAEHRINLQHLSLCNQDATAFLGGNGMAIENGEFIYPKATGPKFEFSDDESEESHDDEDDDDGSDSDDEKEGAVNGKKGKKEAAQEPKVRSLAFHASLGKWLCSAENRMQEECLLI